MFMKILLLILSDIFFETLPVARHFTPEPMIFLIEVNFRKRSKNGTMLSKLKKKV